MASTKTGLFETHSIAPMVAGVSAGVISTSLLLPLDVIKVRSMPCIIINYWSGRRIPLDETVDSPLFSFANKGKTASQ